MAHYYGGASAQSNWMVAQQPPFFIPAQHLSASSMFEHEMGFGHNPNDRGHFLPPYLHPPTYSGRNFRGRRSGPFRGRGGQQQQQQQQQHNNQHRKQPKQAGEKSFAFFCSPCDRGYNTSEKYNEHCATHIECKIDGCKYVAAAKLVDIHRSAQHRNGLFKQIWCLDSPAELKRWIEERKRNYPSAKVVKDKASMESDRFKRGQILTGRSERFNSRFGRKRRGPGRECDSEPVSEAKKPASPRNNYLIGEFIDHSTVGNGTSSALDSEPQDAPSASCEAEWNYAASNSPTKALALSSAGGLSQLMSMYADSEEDGEINEEPESSKNPVTDSQPSSSSVPGRCVDESHEDTAKPVERDVRCGKNASPNRCARLNGGKPASAAVRKSTLVENLLRNELRHERNVILQCIRHIVNSRFFNAHDS